MRILDRLSAWTFRQPTMWRAKKCVLCSRLLSVMALISTIQFFSSELLEFSMWQTDSLSQNMMTLWFSRNFAHKKISTASAYNSRYSILGSYLSMYPVSHWLYIHRFSNCPPNPYRQFLLKSVKNWISSADAVWLSKSTKGLAKARLSLFKNSIQVIQSSLNSVSSLTWWYCLSLPEIFEYILLVKLRAGTIVWPRWLSSPVNYWISTITIAFFFCGAKNLLSNFKALSLLWWGTKTVWVTVLSNISKKIITCDAQVDLSKATVSLISLQTTRNLSTKSLQTACNKVISKKSSR